MSMGCGLREAFGLGSEEGDEGEGEREAEAEVEGEVEGDDEKVEDFDFLLDGNVE